MRRVATIAVFALLWITGCAPKGPQRPPELEAAYHRMVAAPQDPAPYMQLARMHLQSGDYLRARQYLIMAERLPRHDVEQAFRLGVVLAVRAGLQDEAILRCRQALERREDPKVRLLLSTLLEAAGQWPAAELERQMVLAEHPEDPHQLIEMARFYQRSERPSGEEHAVEYYRRYLSSAPSGVEAPQARAALRSLALSEAGGMPAPQRTN